jgi:hypothetical protein
MKKTTETLKALFGLEYLHLWETRPSIILLPTVEDVMNRVAYFYSNPAASNLVNSIEDYPGLSSWSFFKECQNTTNYSMTRPQKWFRYKEIPPLFKENKTPDSLTHQLTKQLVDPNNYTNEILEIKPNAWMTSFGITSEEEVSVINESIRAKIKENEAELKAKREEEKRPIKGVKALLNQMSSLTNWKPKEKTRRIFLICRDNALRKLLLGEFKAFKEACKKAREDVFAGIKNVIWPPGAFVPWFPPIHEDTVICTLSSCLSG